MSSETLREVDLPAARTHVPLATRAVSLAVLVGTATLLGLGAVSGARMITDAWVAPIHLSRDNDAVLQLTMQLNRHTAELARLEAEVERIDGDLEAVAVAIDKLTGFMSSPREALAWQADLAIAELRSLERITAGLRAQRDVLTRLHERQTRLAEAARSDLAAGLISRADLEKQEQALDSVEVSLLENKRMMDEAALRQRQVAASASAFRGEGGRKPEVVATEERTIRSELELMKLRSEERNLRALRRVAAESLATQRALLEEIKTRPLYRAVNASTEVAFVPYTEMDSVAPGASVLRCRWGLFACRQVGVVAEVLPGEVATLDPFGEMARGQYAILELDEKDAIREKVLRIREAR